MRGRPPQLREPEPEHRLLWRASAPPTEMPFADTDLAAEEAPRHIDVDLAALEQALIAPPPAADLATMEQRYPLLRNTLL